MNARIHAETIGRSHTYNYRGEHAPAYALTFAHRLASVGVPSSVSTARSLDAVSAVVLVDAHNAPIGDYLASVDRY